MIAFARDGDVHNVWWTICFDRKFLNKKFDDFRTFTIAQFVAGSCFGLLTWTSDYVIDPVAEMGTIIPHVMAIVPAILWTALRKSRNYKLLETIAVLCPLPIDVTGVFIFDRLHGGAPYEPAGLLLFLLFGIIAYQGFSLVINIIYTTCVISIPHIVALLFGIDHFPHLRFAVFAWPAAAMTIIGQTMFALDYYRRHQLQLQLERESQTDPLTGVHNRRYFTPLLEMEVNRARRLHHPLSLLIFDIDHFKAINDTYGHSCGDAVIQACADLCRRDLRAIDVVARLGGEEFAILLPGTDLRQAVSVADRVRTSIQDAAMQIGANAPVRITVSVGAAECGGGLGTASDFLKRADDQLYRAKGGGRNRVCAESEPEPQARGAAAVPVAYPSGRP